MESTPFSFMDRDVFEGVVDQFLGGLSEKRRAKALITREMGSQCLAILNAPTDTSISNPKHRHWVKNNFIVETIGNAQILVDTKTKKPVALKEDLYQKMCRAHLDIRHGGRNKTYAEVGVLFRVLGQFSSHLTF
jgi:hypothetical protein